MKFSEIIGQKELIQYFIKAHSGNHLSHAYIIEGEKGIGKKTLADGFANYLLCEEKDGKDSCGKCQACVQFRTQNHPDVIYVNSTKKTGYGADDIREGILEEVNVKPYQSSYKIYIIRSAETMTVQAQNILLKTIEEPPVHAMFFLLTENRDKLLPTVQSRCVPLKMRNYSLEEIQIFLEKNHWQEKAEFIQFAEGNLGKLGLLIASENFMEQKRDLENLLDIFIKSPEHDIIKQVKILEKYEDNLLEALNTLQIITRERLRQSYESERGQKPIMATLVQQRYYGLSRNIIEAKKQITSNVNKSLIIWNLFLI